MEIGIIGLPQTGKKTLFNLLTDGSLGETAGKKLSKDPGMGISKVHDFRLDKVAELYKTRKLTPATITYILLPGLSKNSDDNQAAFKSIVTVDALCHVVRAFDDNTVFHVDGSVDPLRDINFVEAELILHDLVFAESRIERLEKDIKRKNEDSAKKELLLIKRIVEALNEEKPLRTLDFSEDEKKVINAYPFLTRKNMLIALNMSEDKVAEADLMEKVQQAFKDRGLHCVQVSCKIEAELSEIDDPEEKKVFLDDLGIERSALEKLTLLSYDALDRLSFFTVGEDECRAWTIRKGENAAQAGGAIHSDIERGFIRAEHMKIDDLLELGSEAKVKEAGKFSLKGKDYIVEDGDILHFRFNV